MSIIQIQYYKLLFLKFPSFVQCCTLQMDNQQSDAYIYQMATHIYRHQSIDTDKVNLIANSEDKQISAWIGLLNILYNQVLVFRRDKINDEEKNGMDVERWVDYGRILHLRGEILRQYAYFLGSVIPEPAYSLISFNFDNFNKFCNDRGLIDLIRHSRGIYPQVDSHRSHPLQFLPYYHQLMEEGPIVVGNYNWQSARKLMKKIWKEGRWNGENRISRGDAGDENQMNDILGEEDQLSIGVKLSNILLTGQWADLEKYINEFNKKSIDNAEGDEQKLKDESIRMRRLNFWSRNYQRFIEDGLEYYRVRDNLENAIELVSEQHGNGMEEIIVSLTNVIVRVDNERVESGILGAEFENKLIYLVQLIRTSALIPLLNQVKQGRCCRVNKLLFLSYVHTILMELMPNVQMENSPCRIFQQLIGYENPLEQPYYRIFFNDSQLLELYTNGKLLQFPSYYNYGSSLMPNILKSIIIHNQNKLVENIDRLNLLEPHQKIKLIVGSRLLGRIGNGEQSGALGEKILQYFEKNMLEFRNLLCSDRKQPINQYDTIKFYTSFVKEWKQVYQLSANFSLQLFRQFLLKYQPNSSHNKVIEIPTESLILKSNFIFPIHRSDIQYHMLKIFINQVQMYKNIYFTLMEEENDKNLEGENQSKEIRKKLLEIMKIMQSQHFKQMLQNFDLNSYYLGNGNNQMEQHKINKAEFIDHVWSIYAEIILMVGQCCRKLISEQNPRKDQKNRRVNEEKNRDKGKKPVSMSSNKKGKKAEHVQYYEIQELEGESEEDF